MSWSVGLSTPLLVALLEDKRKRSDDSADDGEEAKKRRDADNVAVVESDDEGEGDETTEDDAEDSAEIRFPTFVETVDGFRYQPLLVAEIEIREWHMGANVQFTDSYPQTEMRRYYEELRKSYSDRNSLFTIDIEREGAGNYYLRYFFNTLKFDGPEDDDENSYSPMDKATTSEKALFRYLGYTLLCTMLYQADQDANIELDAASNAVMLYYQKLGFESTGLRDRNMSAPVKIFTAICRQKSRDISEYTAITLKFGDADTIANDLVDYLDSLGAVLTNESTDYFHMFEYRTAAGKLVRITFSKTKNQYSVLFIDGGKFQSVVNDQYIHPTETFHVMDVLRRRQ